MHFSISIPHSLSAHLSRFPIYLPIWFSCYVVFGGGGIEKGGRIWPRMAEGPTSTPGQIPIRRRNLPPCKSKAPSDHRQPPLYTLLSNIGEMSKGGPQWPPLPPRPIFYFFSFFVVRRARLGAWRTTTNPGGPWKTRNHRQRTKKDAYIIGRRFEPRRALCCSRIELADPPHVAP